MFVLIISPANPTSVANPIDLVRGEIAILKMLDHRNVVRLFEVLDDPSQVYLMIVSSKGFSLYDF